MMDTAVLLSPLRDAPVQMSAIAESVRSKHPEPLSGCCIDPYPMLLT